MKIMKETYEVLELGIVKFAGDDMIMMSGNDNNGNVGEINPDLGGEDLD